MTRSKRKSPNSVRSNQTLSKKKTVKPSQDKPGYLSKRMRAFRVLMVAFFFSGLCGLVYEVAWSRLLTLVFGNTTYAVSTVVGVFMFGLALGSYFCGRLMPRIRNLLIGYAFVEAGIGVYAALSLPILQGMQIIHSMVFPLIYSNPLLLNFARIFLAFILFLVPTTLMGATLPLLGQVLACSPRFIGRDVGVLYALNTFGAVAGSFLGAFFIIPALGIHLTVLAGGSLNVVIGLVAWSLSKSVPTIAGLEERTQVIPDRDMATRRYSFIRGNQYRLVLLVFIISGFIALLFQIAWTRTLILIYGTSIYAFATILTVYLLGLGLGSILLSRLMDRVGNLLFLYASLEVVIGLSVFLTTPLLGKLPDYFVSFFSQGNTSWRMMTLIEFGVSFLIVIVPTFASGASFPLVVRIFTQYRQSDVGLTIANAYSANTIGCILGSLAAGFILIPSFGVEKTLLLGGGLNLLMASLLGISATDIPRLRRYVWVIGPTLAAVAGVALLPSWNPKAMNSGVYIYARNIANTEPDVSSFMDVYKLLFHKEGASATVTVFQRDDIRFLRVNGKTDGSNSTDNYTQIFLGLLPVMYCKMPENALVIGLGTGITLGSVLDYPMTKVDCVEISPEVVEASRFFDKDSGFPLKSSRTSLHVLDGRTWLMAMPETYDIIISEPSHPWQTGNANLFTVDFFNLAIRKLKRGGIFCQWLPMYHMDKEHFRLLVGSFRKVFPCVHIWMATSDALLIGSRENSLSIDYGELQEKMAMPKIKQRLARVNVNAAEDLLSFFYLDDDSVIKFTEGVKGINSDNYPTLEFSAPKYLLEKGSPDIFFAFLNLSRASKLPIVNVQGNIAEIQRQKLNSRANYFRKWKIPETVIQQFLGQD